MRLTATFHRTIICAGILIASLIVTTDSISTTAQSDCYPSGTVHIVGNMNIREGASTQSRVMSTTRAGESFTVSQSRQGDTYCWLKIGADWIAKTSRVSSTKPAQNSTSQKKQARQTTQQQQQQNVQQQSDINNCCFVDRQCDSDEEWTSGYWAFQNNQCEMPTDSPTQSQTRGTASDGNNNCCFLGWQCDSDEKWRSGFYAFQHDQCDAQQQWQEVQWPQLKQQQQQQQQSSSEGLKPIKVTHNPYTGVSKYEYEDGGVIIVRPPTREEMCNAGVVEFCDDE